MIDWNCNVSHAELFIAYLGLAHFKCHCLVCWKLHLTKSGCGVNITQLHLFWQSKTKNSSQRLIVRWIEPATSRRAHCLHLDIETFICKFKFDTLMRGGCTRTRAKDWIIKKKAAVLGTCRVIHKKLLCQCQVDLAARRKVACSVATQRDFNFLLKKKTSQLHGISSTLT